MNAFSSSISRSRQAGITLIVTLVMLVVLTLLVVSAIRFGNVNLKIAGNVQSKTEAAAATQIAIERVLEQVKTAANIDAIAASNANSPSITAGGAAYQVAWTAPTCLLTKPVSSAELSTTKPADLACFESADADTMIDGGGKTTTSPSACNDQHWGVQAAVDDVTTGTKVTSHQGFSVRVSSQVQCP